MSDATPETPAAKEGGEHAAKPKSPGPPVAALAALVVVGLGAGAALGALVIAPPLIQGRQQAALAVALEEAGGHGDSHGAKKDKKGKKDKKDKKDKKGGDHGGGEGGSMYKLDNLIVNPAGSHGDHFLMCSIAIAIDDEEIIGHLRDHEVQVRDAVISALESQSLSQLTGPGARDSLRHRIARTLMPLVGDGHGEVEMQVFLPQFVIQ
jgi:flagellar basal body-associated protein FliL